MFHCQKIWHALQPGWYSASNDAPTYLLTMKHTAASTKHQNLKLCFIVRRYGMHFAAGLIHASNGAPTYLLTITLIFYLLIHFYLGHKMSNQHNWECIMHNTPLSTLQNNTNSVLAHWVSLVLFQMKWVSFSFTSCLEMNLLN